MSDSTHLLRTSDGSRRGVRDDESGDTLIEVLLTLVILSITVVALMAAFSSSIAASSEYRGLSVTDTLVRTVTEQVIAQFQEQTSAYRSCTDATPGNYTSDFGTALQIPPPYGGLTGTYSASITSVTFWNGTNFGSTCTSGSTVPEEMTITVSGPPGVRAESLSFVVEGNGKIGAAIQLHTPGLSVATSTVMASSALDVIITAPDNASTAPGFIQTYTVDTCTDQQMTRGCATFTGSAADLQTLSGLVPGTPYWVTVFANASPGYLASAAVESSTATTSSGVSPNPSVVSVAPSTTTAGALTVSFTPGTAPNGDTFTAIACTDTNMTQNCVSQPVANQGGSLVTGLTQGTGYFVEVSAAADGSYTGGPSLPYTPAIAATIQLNAPTKVSVASSTIYSGALVVTFTAPSNAPATQGYSVEGCTNQAMSANCVTQGNYTSGNPFTGLTAGTSYYVTVTAVASTVYQNGIAVKGYLASTSPVTLTATVATIQLSAPSITSATTGSGSGKIVVNFTGSSNGAPGQTYTLTACTDALMTQNCTVKTNYVSGHSVSGLQQLTLYYVTITANASSGYLVSSPSVQVKVTSS